MALPFPLHRAIFDNDLLRLQTLLEDLENRFSSCKKGKEKERKKERKKKWIKSSPSRSDLEAKGGVNEKDNRGNTPLHLCAMLGRKECLELLLEMANPDEKLQNQEGWSAMAEAISYGDREMVALLLNYRLDRKQALLADGFKDVHHRLERLPDFHCDIGWEFSSWIPFFSKLCPSDTNRLMKRHSSLRLETTIAGFQKMRWMRGSLSILIPGNPEISRREVGEKTDEELSELLKKYDPYVRRVHIESRDQLVQEYLSALCNQLHRNSQHAGKILLLNHKEKEIIFVSEDLESNVSRDFMVNLLMGSPRKISFLSSQKLRYEKIPSSFWKKGEGKTELVGGFKAQVYEIEGIELVTLMRREHLHAEGGKKERKERPGMERFEGKDGNEETEESIQDLTMLDNDLGEHQFLKVDLSSLLKKKTSLDPPPPPDITAEKYFKEGEHTPIPLGRKRKQKTKKKSFRCRVWCTPDFPLSLAQLKEILAPLAPSFILFQRVLQFLSFDLPPGFPVKIELPILPVLTAVVTFTNFVQESLPPEFFDVPADYFERY